ncbi:MAG: SRPBCC domain-containing protein [bacterium]
MYKKITIQASINADINTVWNKYTDPNQIIHWNFASDDWCCPSASNNLKVGGKYIARMEAKDGSFGFDFEAFYDEIEPLSKLKYSFSDAREIEIYFESKNDSTDIKIIFDAENENPLDMQREGWQAILNNFKSHAEKK